MKNAIVIEPNDIKQILADFYKVPVGNVIKSQYTYTVILGGGEDETSNDQ